MNDYRLTANLNGNQTTYPVKAKCRLTAMIEAGRLIHGHIRDKRFAEGNVYLRDGELIVMSIAHGEERYYLNTIGPTIEEYEQSIKEREK